MGLLNQPHTLSLTALFSHLTPFLPLIIKAFLFSLIVKIGDMCESA